MDTCVDISVEINGVPVSRSVPAETLLIDFLRDDLGLRSVKLSCDMEICGACTVLVDDLPVSSCTTLAADVDGAAVTTVEGLITDGALDPLQQAFIDHGAVQCGFCTPGFILAAKALLLRNPSPTRAEIVSALDGNICRCTGYTKIVEAVLHAASA
ncbi:(2Fe-2S)-binding protein [Hoeflea sp. WL0058]|uniref:(2Fe-2S)-binding protein n=1 Tax=Flavimaribacter sediminis TaxID=2865987 RepID=A0AAE2ZJV8_9HYPH|nr:(2Fe-2S)-binding protein [Flavimaribacter sediminis]MBW8637526.1 (2Fe-2S)-binding protein [Flavimaribacter sediminis]